MNKLTLTLAVEDLTESAIRANTVNLKKYCTNAGWDIIRIYMPKSWWALVVTPVRSADTSFTGQILGYDGELTDGNTLVFDCVKTVEEDTAAT